MKTIAQALAEGGAALSASDSPRLDAEVLLAHVLGKPRSFLFAWPEQPLADEQRQRFARLLDRRANGEPVAYLVGEREFWSLPLEVTPQILIPRPETEILVEAALERIPPQAEARVADLGTGSGAVALAIARERPGWTVVASDRSSEALEVAKGNARRLGLERVEFRLGAWFAPHQGERFSLIVSNPPYLRADDPHLEQGDLRFEPREALVAGADGLEAIREIVQRAPLHLVPGGWLLLEHGYDQGTAVRALFAATGFRNVITYSDLAGRERVTSGQLRLD